MKKIRDVPYHGRSPRQKYQRCQLSLVSLALLGCSYCRCSACRQHYFHRSCLVESRRAGNNGCPNCRGELEKGLTPAPPAHHAAEVGPTTWGIRQDSHVEYARTFMAALIAQPERLDDPAALVMDSRQGLEAPALTGLEGGRAAILMNRGQRRAIALNAQRVRRAMG